MHAIIARMEKTLETQIGVLLRARGLKLGIVESCTGGLVADRITDIAGASEYFLGAIVAYDNQVKINLLNMPQQILEQYGAVSEQAVCAMAEAGRALRQANIVISISGIAGPAGGSPEKPVGSVWLGLAAPEGTWARSFRSNGNRRENKMAFSEAALQLMLDYLQGSLSSP